MFHLKCILCRYVWAKPSRAQTQQFHLGVTWKKITASLDGASFIVAFVIALNELDTLSMGYLIISSCRNLQSKKNQEKGIQNYTGIAFTQKKKNFHHLNVSRTYYIYNYKNMIRIFPTIPNIMTLPIYSFDRLCWHLYRSRSSITLRLHVQRRYGKLGTALLKGLGSSLSRPFVAACFCLFSTQNYSARV